MTNSAICSSVLGAVCALGMLAAAAPALGQESAVQFTVRGHSEGPHEHSLSAAVVYADLDLTTSAGQAVLRQRVRKTAQELCNQLGGGPENATGLAFVCEDEAVEGAAGSQRTAIARATPQTYVAATPTPTSAR